MDEGGGWVGGGRGEGGLGCVFMLETLCILLL